MGEEEALARIEEIVSNVVSARLLSPPDQRKEFLRIYTEVKATYGPRYANFATNLFLLSCSTSMSPNVQHAESAAPKVRRLAVSIHGIRTRGKWQKDLTPPLHDAGFVHHPLDYGFFWATLMLIPPVRRWKVERFREKFESLQRENPGATISVIAHSFGTYIVAKAMEKYPQVRFDRIIFCGSIVQQDYDWSGIVHNRNQAERVLHDFGDQDFWAAIAQWVVTDAGPSGKLGFKDDARGRVCQQEHRGFRHSDHFYDLNYRHRWIPFLNGGDPSLIEPLKRAPFNWRPLIVLAVSLLLLGALLLAWWFWFRVGAANGRRASPEREPRTHVVFPDFAKDEQSLRNEKVVRIPLPEMVTEGYTLAIESKGAGHVPDFGPEDKVDSDRIGLKFREGHFVVLCLRPQDATDDTIKIYPYTYGGKIESIDRAFQVSITVMDRSNLLLRGPRGGLDILRKMIGHIDVPEASPDEDQGKCSTNDD